MKAKTKSGPRKSKVQFAGKPAKLKPKKQPDESDLIIAWEQIKGLKSQVEAQKLTIDDLRADLDLWIGFHFNKIAMLDVLSHALERANDSFGLCEFYRRELMIDKRRMELDRDNYRDYVNRLLAERQSYIDLLGVGERDVAGNIHLHADALKKFTEEIGK